METSAWATSAAGTGLTDSQMREQASFSGWSFTSTWGIAERATYPYLQWQAPVITGVSPAPGATEVAVGANVAVTFNVAMAGSSLNSSTVYLTVAGSDVHVAAGLSWDSGSKTVTLNPTADLVGTTYTVTVKGGSDGAKDAGGQTLPADGTWSFSTLGAGAATHLAVVAPTSATVGGPFNLTVTALDAGDRTASGYTGTVGFSLGTTDSGALGLSNYTFISSDNGVHTFSVTLTKAAAAQTITARDTLTSSIAGTSGSIAVSAAAATHFAVTAPSSAGAGTPFTFTVTAKDAGENTATGYSGTVQFTSSDGAASLPASSMLTSGTGTFSATLSTLGSQTITATDSVTGSIAGTSAPITLGACATVGYTPNGSLAERQGIGGTTGPLSGNYCLATDLNATGFSFTPIEAFTGIFDGQDHAIANLTIDLPAAWNVGLFRSIGTGGQVRNVRVVNASVSGQGTVGALTGDNYGTITSSYTTGSVSGSYGNIGGLAGENRGSVISSYSTATVGVASNVGGLVGVNNGSISSSYSSGTVSGSGLQHGGLVGANSGSIISSYHTGTVSGSSSVGGLVGRNTGAGAVITSSYNTGSVSGTGSSIGGLVGWNDAGAAITSSHSTGFVNAGGGLVGGNSGSVTNSYWDTETSGRTTSTGGTGLTDIQMRQQASFSGWNFAATWGIANGVTYPWLQWQSAAITGATPAPGATGVAVDTAVTVTFKSAMDSATFTDSTFYLTAQGSSAHVPATLGWNGETKTATLAPTAPLTGGAAYTAPIVG